MVGCVFEARGHVCVYGSAVCACARVCVCAVDPTHAGVRVQSEQVCRVEKAPCGCIKACSGGGGGGGDTREVCRHTITIE